MLCRVALRTEVFETDGNQTTVAKRVYNLLNLLYKRQYDNQVWTPEDYPLVGVKEQNEDDSLGSIDSDQN